MVNNRNAQAAMVASLVGIVVIGGWLFAASQIFDRGPVNLAEEIATAALTQKPPIRDLTVGGPPVELIAGVTFSIADTRWAPTRLSATAAAIPPSSPENRFLLVEYGVANGLDETLSMDGFVEFFNIVTGTQTVADARMSDGGTGSSFRAYGEEWDVEKSLEIEPGDVFTGSWYFELDSRISNLRLRSELARVALRLPIDQNHPLAN